MSHKWRELVSSGCLQLFADIMLSFSGVTFVSFLFLFRFGLFSFIEAAALRSAVLQCMMLGVVRCGTGSSSRVRARANPVQHLLCGGYERGLHAFQVGQRHHGRFGAPEENKGEGGRREATAGEPVLATSLWNMFKADDARVVSQSPEQLGKMMGVIVVVCAAVDLIILAAKTAIMCLRTKRMPESTAIFSVEAAGQVYNQIVIDGAKEREMRR